MGGEISASGTSFLTGSISNLAFQEMMSLRVNVSSTYTKARCVHIKIYFQSYLYYNLNFFVGEGTTLNSDRAVRKADAPIPEQELRRIMSLLGTRLFRRVAWASDSLLDSMF